MPKGHWPHKGFDRASRVYWNERRRVIEHHAGKKGIKPALFNPRHFFWRTHKYGVGQNVADFAHRSAQQERDYFWRHDWPNRKRELYQATGRSLRSRARNPFK